MSLVVILFELRSPEPNPFGDATFSIDIPMPLLLFIYFICLFIADTKSIVWTHTKKLHIAQFCLCCSIRLAPNFQVVFWTCFWGLPLFVFQSHKTFHVEDATRTQHRSTLASLSPGTQQTTSFDVYWKSPSILAHQEQIHANKFGVSK